MLYIGRWGTICDDEWDLQDAEVVCRQLGFEGAVAAPCCAAYGQGTGQIWLDDVKCVGNETSISECSHRGWGIHGCSHGEDASVRCKPRGKVKPHDEKFTNKRYSPARLTVKTCTD